MAPGRRRSRASQSGSVIGFRILTKFRGLVELVRLCVFANGLVNFSRRDAETQREGNHSVKLIVDFKFVDGPGDSVFHQCFTKV